MSATHDNIEIEGFRGSGPDDRRRQEQIRPALSESAAEAEAYARRVIDQVGESPSFAGKFDIPRDLWPDGWTYEWKRVSVAGKDDEHHMMEMLRAGWRMVPVARHPDLMPKGSQGNIIDGGLALMELPSMLVDRRQKFQRGEAVAQVVNADKHLYDAPANTAPRDVPFNEIKRGWGPAST